MTLALAWWLAEQMPHGWRLAYLVVSLVVFVALQVWLRTGDRRKW